MKRKGKAQRVRRKTVINNIAFFGDASVSESDPVYKEAKLVAEMLAGVGYTIVNGGGPGVMAAATEGAEKAKGDTLSVTFYPKDAPNFEGRYLKNVTDREIVTSNYIERMFKLMEHSDVFVIFKGGSGTISEFGTAWVLANIYWGNHKPFILYGGFWVEIIDVLKKNLNLDKTELSVFEIVEKPEDVVGVLQRFERRLSMIKKTRSVSFNEGAKYTNK
jgi:uncharacterized protein (TIGR00730 family)